MINPGQLKTRVERLLKEADESFTEARKAVNELRLEKLDDVLTEIDESLDQAAVEFRRFHSKEAEDLLLNAKVLVRRLVGLNHEYEAVDVERFLKAAKERMDVALTELQGIIESVNAIADKAMRRQSRPKRAVVMAQPVVQPKDPAARRAAWTVAAVMLVLALIVLWRSL